MKVFVTGGNGFIGSVVVRELVQRGYQVRCLLRATSNLDRLQGLNFEQAIGDVRDAEAVDIGMRGCDCVIHLASVANWKDLHLHSVTDVIVQGTRNVLAAADRLGRLRTVFVSSAATIGGAPTPVVHNEESPFRLVGNSFSYAHAKRRAEDDCLGAARMGNSVVIVNPTEVYGPNDHRLGTACNLVAFAQSNRIVLCKGGTSIAHVDDVAVGIIAALERGRSGERYILGGENLTNHELADLTLGLLRQRKRKLTIPGVLLRGIGRLATALRIPLALPPAVIPYATLYWFMDNRKAREVLGVRFRSARDTLAPTLAWLRAAGHLAPALTATK